MPSPERLKEAERQMTLCNACRYCEGYCAVFPAMERRSAFTARDLVYLSNLCFECRACFYACPYAPPHEFKVNVPKALAELRVETYRDYAWPRLASGLFSRNKLAVWLATAGCAALVLLLVIAAQGPSTLLSAHLGEGAFYKVIPFAAMVLPASVMLLYAALSIGLGLHRFLREGPRWERGPGEHAPLTQAVREAFGLVYLRGGGQGCNYPNEGFSHLRRWYHHLVFYGFLLDLVATTVAAVYHHVFQWPAPYPFWSAPVCLGTLGGVMLVVGTSGLLYLKGLSDKEPADVRMLELDVAFLVLLLLTSLTGLLLLAFRETPLMGVLLSLHLGTVAALFLTLPYGKFAHVAYRFGALLQNAHERRREKT